MKIKSLIALLISIVLIIVAVVCLPGVASRQVKAGAGNGENLEIRTPNQLNGLIRFISSKEETSAKNADGEIEFLAAQGNDALLMYDSVTVKETSYTSMSGSVSNGGEYSSSNATVSKQMMIYITKNSTLYHSVGFISSTATYSSESTAQYVDFDIEVLVNHKVNQSMIKINKWIMAGDQTIRFSDEIMCKWIKLTDDENPFESVDIFNRDSFEQIGEIIEKAIGDDVFKTSGSTYSLTKGQLTEILGAEKDDLMDGEFTVDMSNATSPKVYMKIDASNHTESDSSDSYYSQRISAHVDALYEFMNVNNTVIMVNGYADILELSAEELESYIESN